MQTYDENYRCYGARKMWLALRQAGHEVARCTVERLMRQLGLQGACRGKIKRTTIADPAAARASDLVGRKFAPRAPNRLWVADFIPEGAGLCQARRWGTDLSFSFIRRFLGAPVKASGVRDRPVGRPRSGRRSLTPMAWAHARKGGEK